MSLDGCYWREGDVSSLGRATDCEKGKRELDCGSHLARSITVLQVAIRTVAALCECAQETGRARGINAASCFLMVL